MCITNAGVLEGRGKMDIRGLSRNGVVRMPVIHWLASRAWCECGGRYLHSFGWDGWRHVSCDHCSWSPDAVELFESFADIVAAPSTPEPALAEELAFAQAAA